MWRSMLGPSMTGPSGACGVYGLHRLHRLHRLQRLHRLERLAPVLDFAAGIGGHRRRGRHHPWRPQPSIVWLLLAGLAVVALAWVITAASAQQRTKTERVLLAGLIVLLGAVVLSFRRSGARYR